jgi:isochorismate synthase
MISTAHTAIESDTEIITGLVAHALQRGESFCLWKAPDSHEKFLLITQEVILENEINLERNISGFAFAPFSPNEQKVIFPAESLYRFTNGKLAAGNLPENLSSIELKNEDYHFLPAAQNQKVDYELIVRKSVSEIEAGVFEKVVPTRFEDFEFNQSIDFLKVFELLCEKHPHAFVSFVSSPQTGTWMGATPELLVSVSQNKFKTIALAGTLPHTPDTNLKAVAWTQKEIEEQALVSRYIINCFKKIRLREYEEHGPKTIVAGNVMHLKTEFEVDMQATNFPQLGSVMLKLLHPTSAVCGMPLEPALDFLQKTEGYSRQFYTGYLGPLNINSQSHLFVNLRCMQLFADKVRFYAGAGVTIDSVAKDEWRETEMKMENLKKLFY